MKKSFLLLSAAFLLASVASAQTVVFDFSNPKNLGTFNFSPMSLGELQTSKYDSNGKEKDRSYVSGANHVLIIDGETFEKDGVQITTANPEKYKDYTRFFFGSIAKKYPADPKPEDFYCDLRWYQKETIEITAPEGKKIQSVVLNAKSGDFPVRANGNTVAVTEGGKQTISDDKTLNEWTADESSNVTTLKYRAADTAPTQMAYSITVTLADQTGSGVENIEAVNNGTVEYYDLTGKRYTGKELTPGLYIRKSGGTVTKILVK